jgi:hypothetical protein
MKVRIKGDSIRYRLVKSEVKKFSEDGYVEEVINFPTQRLIYALASSLTEENLSTDFVGDKITVYFPEAECKSWYESDRITYKYTSALPNGNPLFILIEKDFVCLDHRDEDQSDNYQNPNTHC